MVRQKLGVVCSEPLRYTESITLKSSINYVFSHLAFTTKMNVVWMTERKVLFLLHYKPQNKPGVCVSIGERGHRPATLFKCKFCLFYQILHGEDPCKYNALYEISVLYTYGISLLSIIALILSIDFTGRQQAPARARQS